MDEKKCKPSSETKSGSAPVTEKEIGPLSIDDDAEKATPESSDQSHNIAETDSKSKFRPDLSPTGDKGKGSTGASISPNLSSKKFETEYNSSYKTAEKGSSSVSRLIKAKGFYPWSTISPLSSYKEVDKKVKASHYEVGESSSRPNSRPLVSLSSETLKGKSIVSPIGSEYASSSSKKSDVCDPDPKLNHLSGWTYKDALLNRQSGSKPVVSRATPSNTERIKIPYVLSDTENSKKPNQWNKVMGKLKMLATSPEEKQQMNDDDGRITGMEASEFLAMSKLAKRELKQVWAIADSKRQGFLGFKEFITAMQNELLFAEIEYMQKRELEFHNSNQFLRAKIAESERAQQHHMNLMPGSSEYELVTPHHNQPFDGRNYLQTNELQLDVLFKT